MCVFSFLNLERGYSTADSTHVSPFDHFRITCRSKPCQVTFSLCNLMSQTTSVDSWQCAWDDVKSWCAAKPCTDKKLSFCCNYKIKASKTPTLNSKFGEIYIKDIQDILYISIWCKEKCLRSIVSVKSWKSKWKS